MTDLNDLNISELENDFEPKAPEFRTMVKEFGFALDWRMHGAMVFMKASPIRTVTGEDIMKLNQWLAEWYPGYRVMSWQMSTGGIYAVRNVWEDLQRKDFGGGRSEY